MGGYFLTNNKNPEVETKVLNTFFQKDMKNYQILELGDYKLTYFKKINLPGANHIYTCNGDYAVGVGTFIYNGKIGYDALSAIYKDYKKVRDSLIFNNIRGHFNLILYIDNQLNIVTDKTGTYHSYAGKENGNQYFSTSINSIVENLNKISISKQEVMEFIMDQSFYGGKTPIKEIEFTEFGQIYSLSSNGETIKQAYFIPQDLADEVSPEDLYTRILNYFKSFAEATQDLRVSVDISAGLDSRLVCSILKKAEINHAFNTNMNSEDEADLRIALEIAEGEKRNILVSHKDFQKYKKLDLFNQAFYKLELVRDNFRAAYTPVFFDEKTKEFDIILGGYGGELYRDVKYKGFTNLEQYISKVHVNKELALLFSEHEIEKYKDNLKKKIKQLLNKQDENLEKEDLEKIYYFMRMMHWGGSRISLFNQYAYRIHPLLDYELIYPIFKVSDQNKKKFKLQMTLIEKFDQKIASYQSQYRCNFIWDENKQYTKEKMTFFAKVSFRVSKYISNYRANKIMRQMIEGENVIADDLNIDLKSFNSKFVDLGKVYTVLRFFRKYKNKMSPIKF